MVRLATSFLLSILCSAAFAQDISRTVRTFEGKPVLVGSHTTISSRCYTKPADVFIVSPPTYGRTSLSRSSQTVRAQPGAFAARCNGLRGEYTVVTYRPKAGFTGTDQLQYRVQYASENGSDVKDFIYTIQVVRLPRDLRERGWYAPK